jgi:hypothetical protein
MPHLFSDDDDTFALSDELERLINEHLPSPAAVLRACNLLSDTESGRPHADRTHDWSQMDDPDSDDYLVLPGYWRDAIGWYLCERPWQGDARVVAVIEGSDAA